MIQRLKNSLEAKFEQFAYFIYDHHKKIIPVVMVSILLLSINLYNIKIDVSTESFLYEDAPDRVTYSKFRDQFGRDEKIIVAIKSENTFDKVFLNKLHEIHQKLSTEVPYVKKVDSLINARKTSGEGDLLIVDDLFKTFPIDDQEIADAKAYIEQSPFFEDLLISEDKSFTAIVITSNTYSSIGIKEEKSKGEFDEFADDFGTPIDKNAEVIKQPFITNSENNAMIDAVNAITSEYKKEGIDIHVVGMPAFTTTLINELLWSMLLFVFLLIVSIVFLLSRFFRRKVGVILPMMTVGLSILTTISLMALFGVPLSNMSAILPSFILSIGIGSSVHVLSIFFKEYDHSGDKREAIAFALGHSGLAIVLTTLTTAGSLLSFAVSDIPPIAALGLFAAIGALMALFLTIVFLPAMLTKFDFAPKKEEIETHNKLDYLLEGIGRFSIRNAKSIIGVSFILIVTTLYLSSNLVYKHDPLEWVPEDNEFRVSTKIVDHELKGSVSLEIVIDSGKENGIYNPKLLHAIEDATKEISQIKSDDYFVGKIISIYNILKEINRALNENKEEFYSIPDNQELIAQEFLLFENSGSDDLETMVDSKFTKTRITVKMPWFDAVTYRPFIDKVDLIVKNHLSKYGEDDVTGLIPMMVKTVTATLESTIKSYFFAYGFIAILMILLLGNIKLGLISMIPNIAPVIFGLSAMLIFNMNLDMFTVLIGAIAIGLAVDDTIHFMHNFQRYHHEGGDVDSAIIKTITSTGRAMFMTSVILSLGFFIYMFSNMTNIFNFGAITGIVIIVALLADFILTPALLKVLVKDK